MAHKFKVGDTIIFKKNCVKNFIPKDMIGKQNILTEDYSDMKGPGFKTSEGWLVREEHIEPVTITNTPNGNGNYQPDYGVFKGEKCCRMDFDKSICPGIIQKKYEGCCACHTGCAPCSYCTSPTYCPECCWDSDELEEKEITTFKFC